jgi:hypothetical protein
MVPSRSIFLKGWASIPPNRKPCVIYILGRNRREYLLVDQKGAIEGLKDFLDADHNFGHSRGTSKGQKESLRPVDFRNRWF